MERLTKSDLNKVCYSPFEFCGIVQYCSKGINDEGGCAKGCHILEMYKKLAAYEDADEHFKLGEKYTLEQIIDAIVQADDSVAYAIHHKDREMLEDVLKNYLS